MPSLKFGKKTLLAGGVVGIGAYLFANSRDKNDEQEELTGTIQQEPIPQGSAAGINRARSAWVQMNGAGYDSPANQIARYSGGSARPLNPDRITLAQPAVEVDGAMIDMRRVQSKIAMDQMLSRRI